MPTISSSNPVLESQLLWERYKREVIITLIVVILAVAAWGGYRFYTERRDGTAAKALASAKTAADFQKVITQYQKTPAGESAYLFLADEQAKEKKFEEANATLQSFIDKYPKHQLRGTARMAIAANLESMGKKDEALSAYQRLAAEDAKAFITPIAMVAQVHILREKKQVEEARKVCETVMSQYKDSLVVGEASRQLALLKGNEPANVLKLNPQSLTPITGSGPSMKLAVPPQAVPAGPPGAVPGGPPAAVPVEPKKP